MTKTTKRSYRRGMELYHLETNEKIVFGKWNADKTGGCVTAKHTFVNLTKDDLDTNYVTRGEQDKAYREKRRGQSW
jgi:hypothetical protein